MTITKFKMRGKKYGRLKLDDGTIIIAREKPLWMKVRDGLGLRHF